MLGICSKCAAPLGDSFYKCAQCGAPLFEVNQTPNAPAPPIAPAPKPAQGIGGWLILVGINLALAPVVYALAICLEALIMSGKFPGKLANDYSSAHELFTLEIFFSTFSIFVLLALNYLFYTRSKAFPTAFIIYLCLRITFGLVDHIETVKAFPERASTRFLGSIMVCAAWIAYFLGADRVKKTFVR